MQAPIGAKQPIAAGVTAATGVDSQAGRAGVTGLGRPVPNQGNPLDLLRNA